MRYFRFGFSLLSVLVVLLLTCSVALAAGDVFKTLHSADWQTIGTTVVAVASVVANITNTDRDNKAVGWLSKLINFFALNFSRSGLK